MPTQHRYRNWCKLCKDWRLFIPIGEEKFNCTECEKPFEPYLLSEVPDSKILEQRQRYKENDSFGPIGKLAMRAFKNTGPFTEGWPQPEIHEADAGQKEIDKAGYARREIDYEKQAAERERQKEEARKFTNIGRNDLCLCGSGLKYKKCCLAKIKSYG